MSSVKIERKTDNITSYEYLPWHKKDKQRQKQEKLPKNFLEKLQKINFLKFF